MVLLPDSEFTTNKKELKRPLSSNWRARLILSQVVWFSRNGAALGNCVESQFPLSIEAKTKLARKEEPAQEVEAACMNLFHGAAEPGCR